LVINPANRRAFREIRVHQTMPTQNDSHPLAVLLYSITYCLAHEARTIDSQLISSEPSNFEDF